MHRVFAILGSILLVTLQAMAAVGHTGPRRCRIRDRKVPLSGNRLRDLSFGVDIRPAGMA